MKQPLQISAITISATNETFSFCKIISFVVVFWILFVPKFCRNLLPGASGWLAWVQKHAEVSTSQEGFNGHTSFSNHSIVRINQIQSPWKVEACFSLTSKQTSSTVQGRRNRSSERDPQRRPETLNRFSYF